ncbi:MAG: hypothetical protein KF773_41120 [Deltaproteobacteria bacterium]|nr:hypothetical protein [Deltaproteobacteria bacterium]
MARLDPRIEVLEEHVVGEDEFTLSSYARVRIGDPAQRWFRPLIVREIKPALHHDRALARRFRDRLTELAPTSHHPSTFGIYQPPGVVGDPVAVFECFAGYWLPDVLAAKAQRALQMPDVLVERILSAVEAALRITHQQRIPHGDLRMSRVFITYDGTVKLELGAPWDTRANLPDDWRRFVGLRASLAGAAALGTDPGPADMVAFTRAVCGDPGFPVARPR